MGFGLVQPPLEIAMLIIESTVEKLGGMQTSRYRLALGCIMNYDDEI